MSSVRFNMIDRSGEPSSCGFHLEQITALNHDAVIAKKDALKTAVGNASLCNFTNSKTTHSDDADLPVNPTAVNAQREIGLEVTYVDDNNPLKKYRTTIPGPDLSLYSQDGTDKVDITAGDGLTLKNAIETNAVSEAGNPITVTKMRIVGRRN